MQHTLATESSLNTAKLVLHRRSSLTPWRHVRANIARPALRGLTVSAASQNKAPGEDEPGTSQGPSPSLLDPAQTISWGGTLPSTRRAALGAISGAAIALGGNLGGVTSWLLGLDNGGLAGRLRADILVPVRGRKRCVETTYGFEFTYPASWLGDQTVAYRAAKRAEAERGGPPGGFDGGYDDFGSSATSSPGRGAGGAAAAARRRAAAVAEPVVAFGPPATTGEENVSVIVAPIAPGFSLQSLGDPRVAGERLLSSFAPEGSGLQATLLNAEARTEDASGASASSGAAASQSRPGQQVYYTLEYTVRGPRFFRHNVSVYTSRNDLLYTFNAQCPESRWAEDSAALLQSAATFRLL